MEVHISMTTLIEREQTRYNLVYQSGAEQTRPKTGPTDTRRTVHKIRTYEKNNDPGSWG